MGCGSCSARVSKTKKKSTPKDSTVVVKKATVKKAPKGNSAFVPSSSTNEGLYRAASVLQKRINKKASKNKSGVTKKSIDSNSKTNKKTSKQI